MPNTGIWGPAGAQNAEGRLSEALRGHTACGNKVQAKPVKVKATAVESPKGVCSAVNLRVYMPAGTQVRVLGIHF